MAESRHSRTQRLKEYRASIDREERIAQADTGDRAEAEELAEKLWVSDAVWRDGWRRSNISERLLWIYAAKAGFKVPSPAVQAMVFNIIRRKVAEAEGPRYR